MNTQDFVKCKVSQSKHMKTQELNSHSFIRKEFRLLIFLLYN